MKVYIRDKRSPKPSSPLSSKVMSSIKAKNTSPEIAFRKLLWNNNLRGYRLHWKVEGRPDISFPGRKLAIFVHGCYWHRCPNCNLSNPKSNSSFWQQKFDNNIARDGRKKAALEDSGWEVFVVWECQIKRGFESIIEELRRKVNKL